MSQFTSYIQELDFKVSKSDEDKKNLEEKLVKLEEMSKQYVDMLEAQQLLSAVSDRTTTEVLDFITSIVNKALGEIFPNDTRRIYLKKKLHAEQYAHINVILETGDGKQRDFTLQSGNGVRQIVSFLFNVALIEVRKSRRLLIMDEVLNGLHPDAKAVIVDLMEIFAEEGFQFIFVEYGIDNLGKIYLVEKPHNIGYVNALDGEYDNQVFVFNPPSPDYFDTLEEHHECEDTQDM